MKSTSYSITFDRDSGLTMRDLPGDDCKKMLLAAIDLIAACADGDVYSLQSIENNCIKLTFGFSPETRKKVLSTMLGLELIAGGSVRKAVVEFDKAMQRLANVSVVFAGVSAEESFKLEPGERLQERMQKLVMPKPFLTSIYGEVLQVGGESPNVHLKVTVGGGLTPGPWEIFDTRELPEYADDYHITAGSLFVASVSNNSLDIQEANAALIASAPELYANENANLEVLKNLTVVYEEMENLVATDADVQNVLGPQVTTDVVHGIVIRLRQRIEATEKILAKARGEKE